MDTVFVATGASGADCELDGMSMPGIELGAVDDWAGLHAASATAASPTTAISHIPRGFLMPWDTGGGYAGGGTNTST
ncbi:hypothetical protein GCM10018954_004590 [Kutzneria kofuensis]